MTDQRKRSIEAAAQHHDAAMADLSFEGDATWSSEQPVRGAHRSADPHNGSVAEDAPDLDPGLEGGASLSPRLMRDLSGDMHGAAHVSDDAEMGHVQPEGLPVCDIDDVECQAALEAAHDDRFHGWDDNHRAAFEEMTPEHQAVVCGREHAMAAEANAHYQPLLDQLLLAEPYMQVLTAPPVAEYLAHVSHDTGTPAHELIGDLLMFEKALRYGDPTEKRQAFLSLAEDYGVDLGFPAEAIDDASLPEAQDPRDAQLQALHQRLDTFERTQQQRADRHSVHEKSRVASELQHFASLKNADGSSLYPFAEQVRSAMSDILHTGQASTLADAYKMAAKPLEDALKAEIGKHAATEMKRRAEAVKRAERTRPVRASSATRGVSDASLTDLIRDSMRAA